MAELVYALCAIISVGCAAQLRQRYRRSQVRLLLWVISCFALVAANNVLLFVDRVLFPAADLSIPRAALALAAGLVLLFGLVWEGK